MNSQQLKVDLVMRRNLLSPSKSVKNIYMYICIKFKIIKAKIYSKIKLPKAHKLGRKLIEK